MKIQKNVFTAVVTLIFTSVCAITGTAQTKNNGISRTELQRHDMSAPNTEMVQAHIDF